MNIVITGASRGVGNALTKSFLSDPGNNVFAVSRNILSLEKLAGESNKDKTSGTLFCFGFDLQKGDYISLIDEIRNKIGRIDILVNNAGAMANRPFRELTDDDFDRLFAVNMKAPFRLIRDLISLFNKNAHVVNITSMGGVQGSVKFPGLSLYSASKGALATFTECVAEEFKDQGVRVNALALGAVQTEMLSEAFPGYQAPLNPDEIAGFIRDFAENGHKFFNGKILPVSISTP